MPHPPTKKPRNARGAGGAPSRAPAPGDARPSKRATARRKAAGRRKDPGSPAKAKRRSGKTALDRTHRIEQVAVAFGLEVESMRALDAYRRRIVSVLEHDLRTPVTPVVLQLHLLESGAIPVSDEARHALAILHRNVLRWQATTERLMAMLEDERALRDPQDVDLAALAHEVVREFADRFIKAGVQMHDVPAVGPLVVRAPPEVMRQCVSIMLEQALRATPSGGHVSVSLRSEHDDVVMEVQDGGLGLSAKELHGLNDPVGWAPQGAVQWALPMMRVALLGESLGGKLKVESEGQGFGLCWVLRLPAATLQLAPFTAHAGPGDGPG